MCGLPSKKKLYYISAEFLIGKLLSNNLINLGMYEEVEKALAAHGRELTEIEEMEMEPSLGNGGLGRLAACFLDSIAMLGLPGDGIGLNYHFGLFRQLLVDHKQKEVKNPWITNESWLVRQPVSFAVPYKNFTMHSTLYDIDVPGYNNGCNRLHLFDVDTVDESIVPSDSINFDKHQIQKNLTLFLYPDDSDRAGQLLRIYQQYFMVSNGAQFILMECEQKGYDLHKLYDHVVIQINDTHPSMVIPELIRLLQERGFTMQEAIDVVSMTVELSENKQQRLAAKGVAGQHVTLGVRPQHISLQCESGSVKARMDVFEMMGSEIHLHANVNGRDMVIIVPTTDINGNYSDAFTIGKEIDFSFSGSTCHLFGNDGKNLEF